MYRYLCLSFWSKNKAGICANNRSGWLSEARAQRCISHWHRAICSTSPRCLCGPVWSMTGAVSCVRAVIESQLWAWTLVLWLFPVFTHSDLQGASWSVSHSRLCLGVIGGKEHRGVTHNSPCFSFAAAGICALWVHLLKRKQTISCFSKNPDLGLTVWIEQCKFEDGLLLLDSAGN